MFSSGPGDRQRWLYRVYGLNLQTDIPLASLPTSEQPASVDIHVWTHCQSEPALVWVPSTRYVSWRDIDQGDNPVLQVFESKPLGYIQFRYRNGLAFTFDAQSTQLWVSDEGDTLNPDFLAYLLGPVLGFCLRLKGFVTLHASVVLVGDHAIAFSGRSWMGKSTLAAAFATRGHPVLADDIAVLYCADDGVWVAPAYPRLRLWPDSSLAVGVSEQTQAPVVHDYDKRYLELSGDHYIFYQQPARVSTFFLPNYSKQTTAVVLEKLEPIQAFQSLVVNTYLTYLLDDRLRAEEFKQLIEMVKRVPVQRMVAPFGLDKIEGIVDAVVSEMQR